MRLAWALTLLAMVGCSESPSDLLHAGDELLFSQKYLDAAKRYEAVVLETRDDRAPEAVALRGVALKKLAEVRHHFLHDIEGALRTYRAAAELVPGTKDAFDARLAVVQILRDRLGDPATAATELAGLIDAFPDDAAIPGLRLEHARLAFRVGKYPLALSQAQRLVSVDDRTLRIEAGLLIGSIHRLEGRYEQALERYRTLLDDQLDAETRGRTRFELARCLEELGRLDEALEAYALAEADQVDRDLIAARVSRVKSRIESLKLSANGRARHGGTSIRF